LSLAAAALLFAAGDGAYGRLDGDLTFVGGLGAGVVAHDGRVLAGGDLRLRYLDAAGAAFSYEEADVFGRTTSAGTLRRAFLAGIELRPLFPIRFLKAQQTGRGFVDLTLDSIALDVGTWWPIREATAVRRPGMYVGAAFELPLFARASGLWLRFSGQLRWAAPRLEGDADPTGRTVVLGIGLAWHQVFGGRIVERGDESLD
jgi:hypothetical protein